MFQFPKDIGEFDQEHFRVNPLDHVGLVVEIASEYLYRGFEFDDLAFYGITGLLRACKDYDRGRGVRFSTYSSHWIRSEIRSAFVNDLLLIRVPVHMYVRKTKIERGEIDPDSLSKLSENVWKLLGKFGRRRFKTLPMEMMRVGFCQSESSVILDYRDDRDLQRHEEDREFLLKELTKLEAQEHRIMILLYYKGMLIKDIVKATGISKDMVRKTRDQALQKLRESISAVGA